MPCNTQNHLLNLSQILFFTLIFFTNLCYFKACIIIIYISIFVFSLKHKCNNHSQKAKINIHLKISMDTYLVLFFKCIERNFKAYYWRWYLYWYGRDTFPHTIETEQILEQYSWEAAKHVGYFNVTLICTNVYVGMDYIEGINNFFLVLFLDFYKRGIV